MKKENENLLYQLNQKQNIINDLKNKLQNNEIEGPKYSLKDMLVIYFLFQDGIKLLSSSIVLFFLFFINFEESISPNSFNFCIVFNLSKT